jgi:hypothetical protein
LLAYLYPDDNNTFSLTDQEYTCKGSVGRRVKDHLLDWSYQRMLDSKLTDTASDAIANNKKNTNQFKWTAPIPSRVNVAYMMSLGPQKMVDAGPNFPIGKYEIFGNLDSCPLTSDNSSSSIRTVSGPATFETLPYSAMSTIDMGPDGGARQRPSSLPTRQLLPAFLSLWV